MKSLRAILWLTPLSPYPPPTCSLCAWSNVIWIAAKTVCVCHFRTAKQHAHLKSVCLRTPFAFQTKEFHSRFHCPDNKWPNSVISPKQHACIVKGNKRHLLWGLQNLDEETKLAHMLTLYFQYKWTFRILYPLLLHDHKDEKLPKCILHIEF